MINILTNSTNNFGLNKNLTNYIVSVLSESNDNNTIINSILSYIGDNFNLDKIILLRSNRELTALNSIYEWHSKTSEPSKIKSCDISKNFIQSIKHQVIVCDDFKNFDKNNILYPLVKKLHSQSFICFSLYNTYFTGFLIFSLTSAPHKWNENEINNFSLISKFFENYILKFYKNSDYEKEIKIATSITKSQNLYTYALNSNSYELEFIGENLKQLFPSVKLGELCYKTLKTRNSPCENCPILNENSNIHDNKSNEYFDPYLNMWVSSIVSKINLSNNKNIRLICLSNIGNFIERIKSKDSLTGLLSLSKFQDKAIKILDSNVFDNFAIVFSDINKFKYIMVDIGYSTGNILLTEVARLFSSNLTEDELVCRNGDDKFILLIKYNTITDLRNRIDSLNEQILTLQNNKFKNINIALISGISLASTNNRDVIQLIDRANITRKTLKNSHKSTYSVYSCELHSKITKEKSIEYKMRSALINKEFIVYLQPKIDLSTRQISGAEALVRWLPPDENLIPPKDFIPLFEKNGFVVELDFYVYEEVFKVLRKWLDEKRCLVPISLNVSRIHLRDYNFVPRLTSLINKYNLPTDLIELEITESTFFENINQLLKVISELKHYGFTFSIDDFGSGYSSLNILKDLPIDVLKLDKGFFPRDNISKKEKIIVSTIVDMAKKLDIRVISEGIETIEQCDFLTNIGCDMVQGYLFAKPMPISEFEKIVSSSNYDF
ncbi:putative bifunctional diguanylate cyclase/phosphodiesterase [Clostridium neonatale]|uniref:putative bifunctional diguanylate cyclase/phosphodiesterase n=1 Tax=Clostridium neonatale TaxID=137838 RepID=UPI00291BCF67|nr:putative diguanylate cyclase domain protein [Clostridium neonatale]